MAMSVNNEEQKDESPLEIACYSPKGGVGKTTNAITLATAFIMNDFRVAFVDLDRQRTSTHFFNKVREDLRPKQIHHSALAEYKDIDVVIYDFPPNTDFVPKKGSIVVAPTGSSTFDLHSYASVLALNKDLKKGEKPYTIIKVLNKFSLVRKSDREAMEYFNECVIISQNTAIELATSAYRTIFNFSHPNSTKAQRQFQFLIDCILSKKTIKMDKRKLELINEKGYRLDDFLKEEEEKTNH